MKNLVVFTLNLMLVWAVQNSFAQVDTRPPGGIPVNGQPQWVQPVQEARERQADELRKANEVEKSAARITPAQRNEAVKLSKAAEAEKRATLEEINKILAVPAEYYGKYAEFLKTKNTGISRIFPDLNCDKGLVVDVRELERCGGTAKIKGAGSLYSIRLNNMPDDLSLQSVLFYIGQSDIHFIGGKFIVGNKMTQDIIGDVGNIELSDVTLESDSVEFLKTFKPSGSLSKIDSQNQITANGISANGYSYSLSAPIKLNDTYVLRSIAYYSGYRTFWNTDLLAAFKVVGQEKDGSIVIIWKKLKQKAAPDLRNK